MPGLRVTLSGDDRVLARLAAMRRAGANITPALRSIGESLVDSTRRRFGAQASPDGQRWAPLRPATLARKRRNRDKVLTERGYLRRYIQYRVSPNAVEIGSTRIYSATHQFGASRGQFGTTKTGSPIPWGEIPARPFLGLSERDQDVVTTALLDFISR